MGREIELKIPLDSAEYDELLCTIQGNKKLSGVSFGSVEHFLKSDTYFSKFATEEERREAVKLGKEPKVIRIRSEESEGQKKSYFCIKYKSIQNGVEFNSENETLVQDEAPLRLFMEVAGYKKYFEKNKDSFAVYCKSEVDSEVEFHLELVMVNGHKYVEIEVTQSELEPDRIGHALEAFVRQFGLDPAKKDSRSWMEIIRGAEN